MGQPWPLLSFIFVLFKQTSVQFLQQIYVKNVHPLFGAGIRTHDLWNMSHLPYPLDQGSCLFEETENKRGSQCDQMATLFAQYLAIYNPETLPKYIINLPKYIHIEANAF